MSFLTDSIGELRRRRNTNDPFVRKELSLAEGLTTYDTLMLEKKWITEDPKAIAFTSFMSRAEKALSKSAPTEPTNPRPNKHNNQEWKFESPVEDKPASKKVNGKLLIGILNFTTNEDLLRLLTSLKTMTMVHPPQDSKDQRNCGPSTAR